MMHFLFCCCCCFNTAHAYQNIDQETATCPSVSSNEGALADTDCEIPPFWGVVKETGNDGALLRRMREWRKLRRPVSAKLVNRPNAHHKHAKRTEAVILLLKTASTLTRNVWKNWKIRVS